MSMRGDHPAEVLRLAKEAYGDGGACIHRFDDFVELIREAYEAGKREARKYDPGEDDS